MTDTTAGPAIDYTAGAIIRDLATQNARLLSSGDALAADELIRVYLLPDGTPCVLDLHRYVDPLQSGPRRKTGKYTVTHPDDFAGYLDKHGIPDTEVWADIDSGTIRAVINAHDGSSRTMDGGDGAGWEDHTVTLRLRHTDDWKAWVGSDKKMVSQVEFAEFLEQQAPNVVSPTAADMLELAQTFRANTKVNFESSRRIKSGETQLTYREETEATAGRKGDLAIPDAIQIGVQVYEGGTAYSMRARFRYRIVDGSLLLGYVLERPREVLRDAFGAICAHLTVETKRNIWQTA